MATFNGKDEDLQFRCKSCRYEDTIVIDLDRDDDRDRLWNWLQKHSTSGGDYINVPHQTVLTKEIKDFIREKLCDVGSAISTEELTKRLGL